jgi:membrane protein DedA with SNARE-associated domain
LIALGLTFPVLAYTDGLGLLDNGGNVLPYLAIFALVFGDAIIPILPGETTLNTAAVLAAQGQLELGGVIVAGAVGAIAGDSAVYWIARRSHGRIKNRLEALLRNERVQKGVAFMSSRGSIVIVLGRFVPGMRLAVNFTFGVLRMPYRRFIMWSSLGGTLWATYTVLLAYYVGNALADFPLASIVISGLITTAALAAVFWGDRLRHRVPAPQTPEA